MNMEKETNSGYEIIEKLNIGNSIFVLGSMNSAYGTKYVTWQSNAKNDPTNYFWGHYIQSYENAREDLYKRAYEETLALNPNYNFMSFFEKQSINSAIFSGSLLKTSACPLLGYSNILGDNKHISSNKGIHCAA